MRLLLFAILIIISTLNISSITSNPQLNYGDMVGTYVIDSYTKGNRSLNKKNGIESITLELRNDSFALFEIKFNGWEIMYPKWGTEIGEGKWSIENGYLYIVLDDIYPALYPIQTGCNETIFIDYPYSKSGVLGRITCKIVRQHNEISLKPEEIRLNYFLCETPDDWSTITIKGKYHFTKTNHASLIQSWQERLSEKMLTLPKLTFPRNLNPLPIDIGKDSTFKIVERGRHYYDSINSQTDKKISYQDYMNSFFLSFPPLHRIH